MQYLGVMRGSGMLACGEEQMGRADYDIDGFLVRPGEVMGSGEIRMSPADLDHAFGRTSLQLTTDDGLALFAAAFGAGPGAAFGAAPGAGFTDGAAPGAALGPRAGAAAAVGAATAPAMPSTPSPGLSSAGPLILTSAAALTPDLMPRVRVFIGSL